ncbi:MAG: hypothetical protein E6Q97_30120 [Desulfurellales bacterium]|nr:MAG: hypothetical protein E6Q97_30120 [Desulfurellales bacterium]
MSVFIVQFGAGDYRMTGGTFKRLKAQRYAKPTAEQQARVVTTRICPVCQQPRQVKAGRFVAHDRARDDYGRAIWPVVPCGGGLARAPVRSAGGVSVTRGER